MGEPSYKNNKNTTYPTQDSSITNGKKHLPLKVVSIPNEITKPSIKENRSTGFICLHRSIQFHWLWQDPYKLKWWLDLLLTVNHTGKKVIIGNTLIECNRGQSINSIGTWSQRWRIDPSKVRRFFKLLESDGMIVTENVCKTTRVTVCNYDSYNGMRRDNDEKVMKKRRDGDEKVTTNNNGNKVNNENQDNNVNVLSGQSPLSFKKMDEKDFLNEINLYSDQYDVDVVTKFFNYWTEKNESGKMRFQLNKTWETKKRLANWKDGPNFKKFRNNNDLKILERNESRSGF
jgi:hypothetical protein